ncbi:MAG: PhoU domain-containing protein [Halobacteriota archaeon]|nr:PhoU domain-containing protein [Halobacteriota archaeon]
MVKIEKRKLQMTGGSTLIVSIPINWARELGISHGDEVTLVQQSDKSILLTAKPRGEQEVSKASINLIPSEPPEDILRLLIAHYLVGYDIIRLKTQRGFNTEDRKWIKETVRQMLIGLEVVEESGDSLVLQSLLNYTDLTLPSAISSMSKIVKSMQEDVLESLLNGDSNLARDVIQRDNEVDRFYLLVVRQLKASVRDAELAKKIGVENLRDCIGYRLIVKSLERIGDHAAKIAREIVQIKDWDGSSQFTQDISEVGKFAQEVFEQAVDCLSKRDIKVANHTIAEAIKTADLETKVSEKILKSSLDPLEKTCLRSTLESFRRIAEYGADIAEVTINMSIKEPGV